MLLLASLACSLTSAAGSGLDTSATSPAGAAPRYVGQFDCTGAENGLLVYSGRITLQPGGQVTFKDYDGNAQTGAWAYDVPGAAFTFSGAIALASARYDAASDSLTVVLAPNTPVVHALGGMRCQRAVPGETGP